MKTKVSAVTYNVINRKGLWMVVRRSVAGDIRTVCGYPETPTAEAAAHEVATTLNAQSWREL